jgi:P27 family predicted phage terminase small subunit
MGKRGPVSRPTKLKLLLGNPGHQKLNRDEPQAPEGEPVRPPILDYTGKKFWVQCVADLRKLGLLYETDGTILALACLSYSRLREAKLALKGKPQTFKSAAGFVALRPEVGIMQRETAILRNCLAEMGLTAAARSRIQVPEQEKADELDSILG